MDTVPSAMPAFVVVDMEVRHRIVAAKRLLMDACEGKLVEMEAIDGAIALLIAAKGWLVVGTELAKL